MMMLRSVLVLAVAALGGCSDISSMPARKSLAAENAANAIISTPSAMVLFRGSLRSADIRDGECSMIVAAGKLFTACDFSQPMTVTDAAGNVREISVPGEGSLCAAPDQKHVYFSSNEETHFTIIDTATLVFRNVPYPENARNSGAIATSKDGRLLYLALQRAPWSDADEREVGPILAVYDLVAEKYTATIKLAADDIEGDQKIAIPAAALLSPDGKTLFVGMMQSQAGILTIDTATHRVSGNIPFDSKNPRFPWADPLALAIVDGRLFAILRNNNELAALDLATRERVGVWPLSHNGATGNHAINVLGEKLIVNNDGIDTFDLAEVLRPVR